MGSDYRFDRFRRRFVREDLAFQGGPAPGEPFPRFTLPTVDGDTLSSDDLIGERPVLMIFSSFT